MTKVFIDGSAGTTGLRIHERLSTRKDIDLILLSDEVRKNESARREAINQADIAFLCLPDDAAREAVSFVENPNTAIIDTSTAHRTSPDWTYGFAELAGKRSEIARSKRVSNPGCHASGFVALIEPLIRHSVIKPSVTLSSFSITGYSGGGKKMIAEYEAPRRDPLLSGPRYYGLTQEHKHLKEMVKICGLSSAPVFCPIVAPFYSGMEVCVTLDQTMLNATKSMIEEIYRTCYHDGLVKFVENGDENGFLSASALSGRDDMQIQVTGNEERMVLVSRFDNLGKGASGAAIQNMNILLGVEESTGLNV